MKRLRSSTRYCIAITAALSLIGSPLSMTAGLASSRPASRKNASAHAVHKGSVKAESSLSPGAEKTDNTSAAADKKESSSSEQQCVLYSPTDKTFIHRYLKPGTWMPLSEIKPGMVGYGLTVFHGNKIERFNVEIISVVKKIMNGRDAILARLSGGEMGKNSVIKGMSGSPCYINGKLIGAVSFGFDFEKEPIAGITPIADMLDALADCTPDNTPIAHLSAPSFAIPANQAGLSTASGAAVHMVPLVSPVTLSGFSPRAEEFLANRFGKIGMAVTSGGGGGMDASLQTASEREIKPGSSVCVLLASGDFSIAATGTATARFGNRVVGFGHPFMQAGSVEFPMATGYVHQVMPRMDVSFKMASPVAVVGSMTADRPWGIGGKLGHVSHMIPATYTVVDETRHIEHTYHVQVVDHPELTPELLAATATSAIDATHQTAGPYIAKVESHVEADGIEPISRVDRFSTGMAPKSILDLFMGGDPVGRYVNRTADSIMNNDFQKAAIKNVHLKIVLQDGHHTAKIDRVYIDKAYAAPGDEVKVTTVIKPWNHAPIQKTIAFNVPRDFPDGNMLIGVAGGQEYEYIKNRLGIVDPEPETLAQIAKKIRDNGRGDQVAVVVCMPEQSMMVNGTKLTNPPAYWTKVFISNRHTKGPTLVKGEMKKTLDTDYMLTGSHVLALEVRSPDKASARTAPMPIAAPYNNDDMQVTEQARKAMETFPTAKKGVKSGSSGTNTNVPVVTSATTMISSSGTAAAATTNKTTTQSSSTITAGTGKGYPHVRPLQIWRQDAEEDFHAGKMDDATVDSWGRLSPGFESIADKQVSTEDQIWSSVWTGGNFYYGSAGEVWRWKGDQSKPEVVAKLDGMLIPAMVANSKGVIYAASVPAGHVWAIDTSVPGSKPRIAFTSSEPIIASLAVDDKDNVYAGTAGTGKVYKIDPSGKSSVLFDSDQAHVLSMFWCTPEHTLYIGTGEKGSVYSIDSAGKVRAVYQSPDHFVTGVVKDAKGDLYVSSAGSGHLVRVAPSGEPTTLASSDAFYTLHYDTATDSVFSGDAEGDITMACVDPLTKQPYFMPVCHTEEEAVLALASDGNNLYAGTSNLAVLRSFRMQLSRKPVYTSPVRDAGRTAQWSRLRAYGPFNELSANLSSKLKLETRTGETARPDETWSNWQPAQLVDNAFAVKSPRGRYFQYRLGWDTSKDKLGADKIDRLTLGRIDTTFLPENTTPQISTISIKPGTPLSGKHDVNVSASDTDGDNLLLSLAVSADGGRTWKALKDDIRSKSAKKDSSKDTDADKDNDDDDSKSDKATSAKSKSTDQKKNASTDADSDEDKDKDKDSDSKTDEKIKPEKTEDKQKSEDKAQDSDKSKDGSKPGATSADSDSPEYLDGAEATASKREKSTSKAKPTHKPAAKHAAKKSNATAQGSGSSSSDSKASAEGSGGSSESFTWNWDTSKQKDGNYLVRFTVDDRLSNPVESEEVVNLRSVTVDNSAPEIELIDYKRLPNGRLEFKVTAKDNLTPIANATYKIDDGEPFALGFDPDSIDGLKATLVASGVKAESGSHKLEVKVSDRAGNTATKSITIK